MKGGSEQKMMLMKGSKNVDDEKVSPNQAITQAELKQNKNIKVNGRIKLS